MRELDGPIYVEVQPQIAPDWIRNTSPTLAITSRSKQLVLSSGVQNFHLESWLHRRLSNSIKFGWLFKGSEDNVLDIFVSN